MTQYRKKPIVIEAFQWTGDEHQIEDPEWIVEAIRDGTVGFVSRGSVEPLRLYIETLEGVMIAEMGDWIIRGVAGEIYPCKHSIFVQSYELVMPHDEGSKIVWVEGPTEETHHSG